MLELKNHEFRFMSHEIRTSLNSMLMGVQFLDQDLLKYTYVNRNTIQVVQEIRECGQATVDLLNDILLQDKIETGLLQLEKEELSIVTAVASSINLFRLQVLMYFVRNSYIYIYNIIYI